MAAIKFTESIIIERSPENVFDYTQTSVLIEAQ